MEPWGSAYQDLFSPDILKKFIDHSPTSEQDQNMKEVNISKSVRDEQSFSESLPASSSNAEMLTPKTFTADGRKREAKRFKSRATVSQDEIELEKQIRNYQLSIPKIAQLEAELANLKG